MRMLWTLVEQLPSGASHARNPPSADQMGEMLRGQETDLDRSSGRVMCKRHRKSYSEVVNRMKRLGVAGALIALVVCAVAGPRVFTQLWTRAVFAYSDWRYDPGDPRNIHYILWKRGLNGNMNLDTTMAAFYLDTDRDRLIRGWSRCPPTISSVSAGVRD